MRASRRPPWRLPRTFDAAELARLSVRGIQPDPKEARRWYERARQLGASDAEERLRDWVVAEKPLPRRLQACVAPSPPPVAPGCQGVARVGNVGDGVEPVGAPGMAAADARERQPAAAPGAVAIDGFERVFRAGRQVPALPADQRLQRPAIGVDRRLGDGLGQPPCRLRWQLRPRRPFEAPQAEACAASAAGSSCLASALASAASTASNTSSVEACRAL